MNAPFDRTLIRMMEAAKSGDINRAQGQLDRTIRFLVEHAFGARASDSSSAAQFRTSFLGNSLHVGPVSPAAMSVQVAAGLGFAWDPVDVPSDIGAPNYLEVDDLSAVKPLPLLAPVTFATPAAPAGPNTRVDIVEVRTDRVVTDPDSRNVWDDGAEAFIPNSVDKTLQFVLDGDVGTVSDPANSTAGLSYKVGTPGNPGVAPATTPGYTKIAEVNVGSAAVSLTETAFVDRRVLCAPGGVVRASMQGHYLYNGGAPTFTVNGVSAPPGVQFGVYFPGGAARGQFGLTIAGGEFRAAAVNIQATLPAALGGSAEFVHCMPEGPTTLAQTSVLQSIISVGAIPLKVGVGQKIATGNVYTLYQAAGVTSTTNVRLEDLTFNIQAALAY